MTPVQMREQLKKLNIEERLIFVETALQLIREDIASTPKRMTRDERRKRLAESAKIMRPKYEAGGELTAFTALDGEDFYDWPNYH